VGCRAESAIAGKNILANVIDNQSWTKIYFKKLKKLKFYASIEILDSKLYGLIILNCGYIFPPQLPPRCLREIAYRSNLRIKKHRFDGKGKKNHQFDSIF